MTYIFSQCILMPVATSCFQFFEQSPLSAAPEITEATSNELIIIWVTAFILGSLCFCMNVIQWSWVAVIVKEHALFRIGNEIISR